MVNRGFLCETLSTTKSIRTMFRALVMIIGNPDVKKFQTNGESRIGMWHKRKKTTVSPERIRKCVAFERNHGMPELLLHLFVPIEGKQITHVIYNRLNLHTFGMSRLSFQMAIFRICQSDKFKRVSRSGTGRPCDRPIDVRRNNPNLDPYGYGHTANPYQNYS